MGGISRARALSTAAGAAAAGVLLWSTVIERRWFALRRSTLPVLAPGAAPLRVLHLSDLHLAPWQRDKIDWVRSLARLRPDLVVLTGDLMGHAEAHPSLMHALEPFAEAGVAGVFVHGSNDYYGPILKNPLRYLREPSRLGTRPRDLDTAALTRALSTDLGFADLNNASAVRELRDTEVEFFGLGDPHIRLDDAERMRSELARTRAGGDERPSAPLRVGVVHAPYQSALGALLDEGADLLLAGHTHGGQVRIPWLGAVTANCDLPTAQARGVSVWYDAHRAAFLNVSAGLGTSIMAPVRFCCRPEATLLTLVAPDD